MIHEPKLTDELKRKIIQANTFITKGGVIGCGHDYWDNLEDIEYGDTILCSRCCQYFVKMRDLPWWVDGNANLLPHSAHLIQDGDVWMHPVSIRLQDEHGNTIHKS